MSTQDERHGDLFMEQPLEIKMASAYLPISRELAEDCAGMGNVVEEIRRQQEEFAALPEEEKARRRAESEARWQREAEEREAKRCPTCGRLPEEYDEDD